MSRAGKTTKSSLPRGNLYVTSEGLEYLKGNYHYSGADKSILAAMMQKWWNYAVLWIPMNVAYKLIADPTWCIICFETNEKVTLVGFFFIICSYLISVYYCPYIEGGSPQWVYFFHTFCIFAYQTLDACDGKHARRTKTSSPLGELFDHGCDAVSTTLVAITCFSSMQVGTGWYLYFLMLMSNVVFFFAQWEQYTIGTLTLGHINVTEAQFTVMIVHTITGIFGPSFWSQQVSLFGYSLPLSYAVPSVQWITIFFTLIQNVWNVLAEIKMKKLNGVVVFSQLLPVLLSSVFLTLWAAFSPSRILHTHPHAFYLALGFLFSNLTGRIVFGRMSNMPFSWNQPLVLPLLLAFVNATLHGDDYVVVGMFLIYFAAYAHFALSIIDVLCEALGIQCLTIPSTPSAK